MFCPKCGSKNEDNAAFCSSCGEKLNKPQVTEATKEAPAVTTTATDGVTAGVGSTVVAAKKTGTIVGIVVAVVIIAAIVVAAITTGGFGLMGGSSEGGGLSQNSPSLDKRSVNDYTWDELSAISSEISDAADEDAAIEIAKGYNLTTEDGKLNGTQTKLITLSNGTEAEVQIAGFYHDDKADGSGKAGITFIFKNAIARRPMDSRDADADEWENTQMRMWLESDGINMLPNDLKSVLVEVRKTTRKIVKVGSSPSVNNTKDKLWLYSRVELCGKVMFSSNDSYDKTIDPGESEYKLYRDMDVIAEDPNDILTKTFNGLPNSWWERSRIQDHFGRVGDSGTPLGDDVASNMNGVVPGFCI